MYPKEASNPLSEEMILSGKLEPTNEGYALAKTISTRLCEYISNEDRSMVYRTIIPCNLYGRFDKFNPQIASRLVMPLTNISNFNKVFKNKIKIYLNNIIDSNPSNDVYEVVKKSLIQ